ncbi:MAG: proline dehydrogenase family protein [Bacteroidota bacterium]
MMDFENTKIAFKSKSNKELKKAYLLFSTIKHPWLVKTGKLLVNIALGIKFPIKWIVKPTIYAHFCGGETISECEPVVQKLAKHNVKTILDYSVEGKESPEEMQAALDETIRAIKNASKNPDIPFAVFKPTAFGKDAMFEKASSDEDLTPGEQEELDRFRERIDKLAKTAYEGDIPIMIDAEDYCYQKVIDQVVTEMMEKYNKEKTIVFNTLQMYRWDRLDFLKEELRKAQEGGYYIGMKFVRGAYMEKERERAKRLGYPSPIHPDKESTDRDYNAALKFSVENIEKIAIFNGTHNEQSSLYLTELMEEHGIAKDDPRAWFSQLYGMSDHISFNLAEEGYNVAKYLPYGPVKNVLPYLIRRAEENTSVAGQTSRELNLLKKEINRRKKES